MTTADGMPVVVFVCVQNAGRSQMAEALFNQLAQGRALARSAGSRPAEDVHPVVIDAMAEIGIDLSAAKPKGLTPDVTEGADWVVGMGCGDECPLIPGSKRIDWEVADPANASLNGARGIRNDVKRLVELLVPDVVSGS
jgi:arsenate reductase